MGTWAWTYYAWKDADEQRRGTFGDMFGGLNALFSGLAFAGIIITILLQSKELALQRQELKETREELKRTATAQEKSEKALNRQAENLKISAKLSALNSLLSYYTDLELQLKQIVIEGVSVSEVKRRKEEYLNRIEELLLAKESDYPDFIFMKEGRPKLTTSIVVSSTQLSEGSSIDLVIGVHNVGSKSTIDPVILRVTNFSSLSGLTITQNKKKKVAIGFDDFYVNNDNWSNSMLFDTLEFKTKKDVIINEGSSLSISLEIIRGKRPKAGSNGFVNFTITLSGGSGGSDSQNSSQSVQLIKN